MLTVRTSSQNTNNNKHDIFNVPFWYELKDRGRLY